MSMKKNKILVGLSALLLSLTLGGCGSNQASHPADKQQSIAAKTISNQAQNQANFQTFPAYTSGSDPVVTVNNNQSTLNPSDWKENEVVYSKRDDLGRTSSPAIAYLEQRNVANDSLRTEQTVKPTGWHQKKGSNGEMILNRGHIIAYSLSKGISTNGTYDPKQQSGDQNNPNNLFTQTAFCNQELQTVYETKVRQALEQDKQVIYEVQPIFQGRDLMPYGVHMQAISTDKSLNFNVFIYNVQPGFDFNYATGESTADPQMQVPKIPGSPTFNDNNQNNNDHNQDNNNQHRNHPYAHAAARGAAAAVGYHVVRHALAHHRR